MQARKQLLKQKVPIVITHNGKQHPLGVITEEVREFISTQNHSVEHTITPDTDLVGRHIIHLLWTRIVERNISMKVMF